MKSFITSQFLYCLLIWMFHNRNMKNRINRIHEKDLRLVYDDSQDLFFSDLLLKDKSVTKDQKSNYIILSLQNYVKQNKEFYQKQF